MGSPGAKVSGMLEGTSRLPAAPASHEHPFPAGAALGRLGAAEPPVGGHFAGLFSARYLLGLAGLALAYFLLGSLGLLFSTVHRSVSPLWPPTGVAFAVLFAGGFRFWPGVALGTLAVTLTSELPLTVSLSMIVGNTLEGLAGAWMLRTLTRIDSSLERVADLPGFAAAALGAPIFSAVIGSFSMVASGLIPPAEFSAVFETWWRGDVIGALVVTPLLLEWRAPQTFKWTQETAVEAVVLVAGLVVVCGVVFAQQPLVELRPFAYVVFPMLTWAAWRFGPRGSSVATMLVAVAAIWGTAQGFGPFASDWWGESVAGLQVFLVVVSSTALLFGAATADRRRIEAAIMQSEARQAALLRVMPDAMLRLGKDGLIRDCQAGHEIAALPAPHPFVGRLVTAWLPSAGASIREHLERALETGALQTFAFEHAVSGGSRHVEVRLVPSAQDEAVAILRDVTDRVRGEEERRRLERQFQESQKLESLGVLAGGIAHDFNNLLTTILGNASLVRYELTETSPVQQYLEQIESSSRRAADLCRQLLAYAGKGRFVIEQLDLSELVRDTTELLQLSISKSAILRFDLASRLPAVQADATQVRQVIMNLVMNASDAIGDGDGSILLRTRAVAYRRGDLHGLLVPGEPPDGHYVAVGVEDDGCGIPPELRERMFEPFFTTKFTGRGLGLSAVLGIVRGHDGALHVESEVGRGSRFTLLMPAAGAIIRHEEAPALIEDTWLGGGTVLVIDDEVNVRRVSKQLLESLGFDVLVSDAGAAGLEVFTARAGEIRAVLLDMLMPGLDGHAVLKEMRRIRPDTCVVLMSGFSEQAARVHETSPPPVFLQKPFGREQLRDALRRAIE
jgi:signal transduction histidine kinase